MCNIVTEFDLGWALFPENESAGTTIFVPTNDALDKLKGVTLTKDALIYIVLYHITTSAKTAAELTCGSFSETLNTQKSQTKCRNNGKNGTIKE